MTSPSSGTSYRVLVTGSRDWPSPSAVYSALDDQVLIAIYRGCDSLVVVHGACPTGADYHASIWSVFPHPFADLPVLEEAHPADWDKFKLGAGPKRNREMVNLGADVCLAFIKNGSRGASGCADLAEGAGIPTHRTEV